MKSVNLLVFVIVWYGVLYVWRNPDVLPSDGVSSKPLSNPLYWILFSVPLFSFVYTLYDLANGFRERSIVFDGVSRIITKGARTLAHFADVDAIHIKEITTQDDVVAEYHPSLSQSVTITMLSLVSHPTYQTFCMSTLQKQTSKKIYPFLVGLDLRLRPKLNCHTPQTR
jgi:hypothetical protein